MKPIIILDSGPLGLLMQRRGLPIAESCRKWLSDHLAAGTRVVVPEIADYEVRRELLRLDKKMALHRLDAFNNALPDRYLPITTRSMKLAAQMWADTRSKGRPTADPKELDADVIVAAQALTSGFPTIDLVIATTNPIHLARFVTANLWQNI